MHVRQLATRRGTRELRWTFTRGISVRAYLHGRAEEECPCVSTRSAELVVVMDGEIDLQAGPERRHLRLRDGEACWIPRGLPHAITAARDARRACTRGRRDVTGAGDAPPRERCPGRAAP